MKFELNSSKGIADVLRTYKIPAEVWMDRNELLVVCRKKDVGRTDFLLFLLNLPGKVRVDGALPWYANRIQSVKVKM